MNRLELLDALGEVASQLRSQGATARVYIVGGAAIALAYDGDRVTRDIDALILEGHGPLTEAVRAVGRRRGLPDSWLNEQASSFLPADVDRRSMVVFDDPALRVVAAAPERVLAMKVRAARRTDLADIELLIDLIGLASPNQVFNIVEAVYPDEVVPERGRIAVEALFEHRAESGHSRSDA